MLLPFSSYMAALPLILEEWGMSKTQGGVVFSAYLVGYAATSLLLIPLVDRLSPRYMLIAGVIVAVVSNLLFSLMAHDMWTGALLRLFMGAGHVAVYIPGIQLVSRRYSGGKRGRAVGFFVSAGYVGTTVSYVFMGLLLNSAPSWQTAYFITALVGFAGVPLAVFLARGDKTRPIQISETARTTRRLSLNILRDRSIALIILAYALHTAELYLARLWLPLLLGAALIQSGREPLEAATLAATLSGFMFMTGIAGVFIGGLISDYLGRSMSGAIIFAVSGACSFAAGWLVGMPLPFLIVVGFVYGFATATDSAIYLTAITELSPSGRIGSAQATQAFVGFTLGAIAPIVAGSILDIAGSSNGWGLAFSFNGVLAVIGVLSLLLLRRLPTATRMASGRR